MIASLRGRLLEKHPNQAIVDIGGVGYDVTIPVSTFSSLGEPGGEVRLRIHTHVREDAIQLFGFLTADEKTVFERLISVTGIGPTAAIKVLSGVATADLVSAIREGAIDRLVRIPGVGKKTAERIVLELKDKLDMLPGATRTTAAATQPADALTATEQDVLSALLNLGCQRAAAETAVRKARGSVATEFEPLFRKALELVR